MAQSTEFRNPTLPQARTGGLEGGVGRVWEKVKLAILRTVLWAYERGTWQYDLLVLAILASFSCHLAAGSTTGPLWN